MRLAAIHLAVTKPNIVVKSHHAVGFTSAASNYALLNNFVSNVSNLNIAKKIKLLGLLVTPFIDTRRLPVCSCFDIPIRWSLPHSVAQRDYVIP